MQEMPHAGPTTPPRQTTASSVQPMHRPTGSRSYEHQVQQRQRRLPRRLHHRQPHETVPPGPFSPATRLRLGEPPIPRATGGHGNRQALSSHIAPARPVVNYLPHTIVPPHSMVFMPRRPAASAYGLRSAPTAAGREHQLREAWRSQGMRVFGAIKGPHGGGHHFHARPTDEHRRALNLGPIDEEVFNTGQVLQKSSVALFKDRAATAAAYASLQWMGFGTAAVTFGTPILVGAILFSPAFITAFKNGSLMTTETYRDQYGHLLERPVLNRKRLAELSKQLFVGMLATGITTQLKSLCAASTLLAQSTILSSVLSTVGSRNIVTGTTHVSGIVSGHVAAWFATEAGLATEQALEAANALDTTLQRLNAVRAANLAAANDAARLAKMKANRYQYVAHLALLTTSAALVTAYASGAFPGAAQEAVAKMVGVEALFGATGGKQAVKFLVLQCYDLAKRDVKAILKSAGVDDPPHTPEMQQHAQTLVDDLATRTFRGIVTQKLNDLYHSDLADAIEEAIRDTTADVLTGVYTLEQAQVDLAKTSALYKDSVAQVLQGGGDVIDLVHVVSARLNNGETLVDTRRLATGLATLTENVSDRFTASYQYFDAVKRSLLQASDENVRQQEDDLRVIMEEVQEAYLRRSGTTKFSQSELVARQVAAGQEYMQSEKVTGQFVTIESVMEKLTEQRTAHEREILHAMEVLQPHLIELIALRDKLGHIKREQAEATTLAEIQGWKNANSQFRTTVEWTTGLNAPSAVTLAAGFLSGGATVAEDAARTVYAAGIQTRSATFAAFRHSHEYVDTVLSTTLADQFTWWETAGGKSVGAKLASMTGTQMGKLMAKKAGPGLMRDAATKAADRIVGVTAEAVEDSVARAAQASEMLNVNNISNEMFKQVIGEGNEEALKLFASLQAVTDLAATDVPSMVAHFTAQQAALDADISVADAVKAMGLAPTTVEKQEVVDFKTAFAKSIGLGYQQTRASATGPVLHEQALKVDVDALLEVGRTVAGLEAQGDEKRKKIGIAQGLTRGLDVYSTGTYINVGRLLFTSKLSEGKAAENFGTVLGGEYLGGGTVRAMNAALATARWYGGDERDAI